MKQLTILRHAKAERPEGYATDAERPLTSRGHKDSAFIGEILRGFTPPIDWIISSPAVRTRQTADHIVEALDFDHKVNRAVVWDDSVYDATADALLTALTLVPPDVEHGLLIGHNPGMEALVSGLCAGAPGRLNLVMATAALASVKLEIFRWNQIRWGCGQLQFLVKPKLLRD